MITAKTLPNGTHKDDNASALGVKIRQLDCTPGPCPYLKSNDAGDGHVELQWGDVKQDTDYEA